MLSTLFLSLYHRWQIRSLRAKLLVPIAGLMVISLLASTMVFLVSTTFTRNWLLDRQTKRDARRVSEVMTARTEKVPVAARLLAGDPNIYGVVHLNTEEALSTLNARAVLIRNRFSLDLVQIYDQTGEAQANVMPSSLYRESSLLDLSAPDHPTVVVVGERVLLLCQAAMPEEQGAVLVGIDLQSELDRIVSEHRLVSDLGLSFDGVYVGTRDDLPFDRPNGWRKGVYSRHTSLVLGESKLDFLLARPTSDVEQVMATGLVVMIGSAMLTTILLIGLSVLITRSVARPIHRLSEAVDAVARGNLDQTVRSSDLTCPFGIGDDDEIGLLADNFNRMVVELRGLYGNLETKVEARTHELATAAQVARVVSSSLELETILRKTVRLIQKRQGFYYVAVYLVDVDDGVARIYEATGRRGQRLKEKKFRILLDANCPVAVVATTGRPDIVHDVRTKSVHLKPPLLLDTRSAVAVPLLFGEEVIGVIDVQSRRRYAFTSDQVNLLVALADQIAVGVYNAQLYGQQRRSVERLSEADRLKTQFLAIISHELRTPLNSIIGFSKVMLKGMDGPLNERQEQDLKIIWESGQHLLSLIQDILDVSQINAGRMQLSFEAFDFGQLVEGLLDAVSTMIQEKAVVLRADIEPNLPSIYADKRRVRQIMLNLLSNAAKFTKSGQITVRAHVVEALGSSGYLVPFLEVAVTDTGIGIPEDKQSGIFKEFIQADGSSTRRHEGAGLGLPITKKLVELHHGRIWVESEVGRGSTFAFVLPLDQPQETLSVDGLSEQNVKEVGHEANVSFPG